jgi:hypothetical protein
MSTKLYEHDGKKLSLTQWSKETGLDKNCLAYRLQQGWDIGKALTTPSNSVANRTMSDGRAIQVSLLSSWRKIWEKMGQAEFERQLEDSFRKDARQVVRDVQPILPRNNPDDQPTTPTTTALQINNIISPDDFKYFKPIGGA